ncbi:MAG: hypothetical protein L0H93_17875 [Nocardioides sp.]|nr:hypothetical protein [Nocardioides sp.]
MTITDYTLRADAHQRQAERRTRTAEDNLAPRPRRRHALAQQFRRIANAIDN